MNRYDTVRIGALAALVGLGAMLLTACGPGGPQASTTASSAPVTQAATSTTPNSTAASPTTPSGATTATPGQRIAGNVAELIEQKLRQPGLSDFEREVLTRSAEAGAVSQADYDEAFRRYEECVSALGYRDTWTQMPNGVYRITPPSLVGEDAAKKYIDDTNKCADGTTMRIESVFTAQQSNPDLIADPMVVAIGCLRDRGFVDDSYTPESLDRDLQSGFVQAPFDVADPAVNECLFNAGIAVTVKAPQGA